jgi:hypothetical protein
MADILAGERYVDQERESGREQLAHRVLLFVILALVIVIISQVTYHLVIAPRLAISTITINSELSISDDELLRIAGARTGMNYFAAEPAAMAARIEQHPEVSQATVERAFPDRLVISAQRRIPLAAAIVTTEAGARSVVFDREGVVFAVGSASPALELPVISGLRFPELSLGLQLPPLIVGFLDELDEFRLEAPNLYRLFSEYRVVRLNDHACEVVAYPMHFAVPVRIGTGIDQEKVEYILIMLDTLRASGELDQVAELDVRGRDGVVRYKEPSDG